MKLALAALTGGVRAKPEVIADKSIQIKNLHKKVNKDKAGRPLGCLVSGRSSRILLQAAQTRASTHGAGGVCRKQA